MARLPKVNVKKVVIASLKVVSDPPTTNVEQATFAGLTDQQQHSFLYALKRKLRALPYLMNNGTSNHYAHYDVFLKPDSVDDWPTVGECIDWIFNNQIIVFK